MGFVETTLKHRRLQSLVLIAVGLLLGYDAHHGTILRSAYGDIGTSRLLLWSIGLLVLLGPISLAAMLPRFDAAGGQPWTEGGREQFAHAKGFAVATYARTIAFFVTVLSFPYLQNLGVVILNNAVTISLLAILVTVLSCNLGARFIFRK